LKKGEQYFKDLVEKKIVPGEVQESLGRIRVKKGGQGRNLEV